MPVTPTIDHPLLTEVAMAWSPSLLGAEVASLFRGPCLLPVRIG